MHTETIAYGEGASAFDVFFARPAGDGPHPTVLTCHAWGGRSEFDEDVAKKLASLGYVGAAIDVYGVGRRGHDTASSSALMTPLVSEPAELRRRLREATAFVRAQTGVDPNRMAAMGFCFGGLCSLLLARMGEALRGVVSFHGLLKIGEQLETPVQAKMLILHGQDDPMVPPSDVGAFAEEMKRIDADWQLHAFPGVKHAFTNPVAGDPTLGLAYDADADAQSWREATRFLEDVLG